MGQLKSIGSCDEEFLLLTFKFLEVSDLGSSASLVSSKWRDFASNDLVWLELCRRCWSSKVPAYRLTPTRFAALCDEEIPWKELYRRHWLEGLRISLTEEELSSLVFDVTFRKQPEARLSTSLRFEESGAVFGHPSGMPDRWLLSKDGTHIEFQEFPTARVVRRADWGWAVVSCNVVCCSLDSLEESCEEEGECSTEAGSEGESGSESPLKSFSSDCSAGIPSKSAAALYPELFNTSGQVSMPSAWMASNLSASSAPAAAAIGWSHIIGIFV
eukprot:TRINITY_DN6902_c2_g1_i1.p1 TRINITY_DN6902_c2_g1~~TRINITY_DN6902_c2_g1_i1.p1  ORF type:complete len:272 (+),score=48.26 TRINITY_DN6902_c2_g1_i1:82-897(+)